MLWNILLNYNEQFIHARIVIIQHFEPHFQSSRGPTPIKNRLTRFADNLDKESQFISKESISTTPCLLTANTDRWQAKWTCQISLEEMRSRFQSFDRVGNNSSHIDYNPNAIWCTLCEYFGYPFKYRCSWIVSWGKTLSIPIGWRIGQEN